jgi:UrcA family protein
MTKKNRNVLLGSALATALLCGAGAALAQGYAGGDSYTGPAPENSYYDAQNNETVIVRPYYDRVEKHQLTGRFDGQMNPVKLSISHPVIYSDLDLTRRSDVRELHARIENTARSLCTEIEQQNPDLNDMDGHLECVRTATRDAMDDVLDRRG